MSLFSGKLIAGALFAGALFGGQPPREADFEVLVSTVYVSVSVASPVYDVAIQLLIYEVVV